VRGDGRCQGHGGREGHGREADGRALHHGRLVHRGTDRDAGLRGALIDRASPHLHSPAAPGMADDLETSEFNNFQRFGRRTQAAQFCCSASELFRTKEAMAKIRTQLPHTFVSWFGMILAIPPSTVAPTPVLYQNMTRRS